jgi:hypothetical protein
MININPCYSIGEYVKAYYNIITEEGISNRLGLITGTIKKIIIERDILTKEYIYLYELDNGELYNEKSLMKAII